VAIDYELAACELTTELLNVGKSRIWFLTGLNDDASQIRRYSTVYIAGMRRALRERGLPETNGEVLDLGKYGIVGDFDFHCRYVEKMLSLPPDKRPDALLCMNGTLAAAYINMLTIAGASIPDDVAVASFLGGRHDKQCNPYITSLLPPNDSLGREAMQVVADLIEGQRQRPLTMLFQHHIRFGGSTRKELCPFEMIDD
jgi:DNA-binding LacI/PurR family transcriptional regulator